jgi:hypothetical protein
VDGVEPGRKRFAVKVAGVKHFSLNNPLQYLYHFNIFVNPATANFILGRGHFVLKPVGRNYKLPGNLGGKALARFVLIFSAGAARTNIAS